MQKITPFLWFDDNLEEAINFYTSVFKNSKIVNSSRLPGATAGSKGKILTATFQLEGQEFMGLNGGPHHSFTDATSFFVKCDTQQEIDYYWDKLTADGGKEVQCGWLKDKFGLSWQIVPSTLGSLLSNPDPAKAQRAMQAMMKMVKLDIAALKAAAEG
jgi:predicted 3-demethylubiquinone-9 3-methyltransferase (glyoxalase superfamily)